MRKMRIISFPGAGMRNSAGEAEATNGTTVVCCVSCRTSDVKKRTAAIAAQAPWRLS
jgi:hypothetical protein